MARRRLNNADIMYRRSFSTFIDTFRQPLQQHRQTWHIYVEHNCVRMLPTRSDGDELQIWSYSYAHNVHDHQYSLDFRVAAVCNTTRRAETNRHAFRHIALSRSGSECNGYNMVCHSRNWKHLSGVDAESDNSWRALLPDYVGRQVGYFP